MDINKELLLLFDDPLFVNVKIPAKALTVDDRMVEKLMAINAFVRNHEREPSTSGCFEEKKLARSLKALRESGNESLKDYDEFHLL